MPAKLRWKNFKIYLIFSPSCILDILYGIQSVRLCGVTYMSSREIKGILLKNKMV